MSDVQNSSQLSLPEYFQPVQPCKTIKPLAEVKLLMFSKGNSSEDISFTSPAKT